jgi:hypothetical protein
MSKLQAFKAEQLARLAKGRGEPSSFVGTPAPKIIQILMTKVYDVDYPHGRDHLIGLADDGAVYESVDSKWSLRVSPLGDS